MSAKRYVLREPVVDQHWRQEAACKGRSDLPWVDDAAPNFVQLSAMREVCSDCPVFVACGEYGLTQEGGLYAGVFVPWSARGEGRRQRDCARARADLRAVLRAAHFAGKQIFMELVDAGARPLRAQPRRFKDAP